MKSIIIPYHPNVEVVLSLDEISPFQLPEEARLCLSPISKSVTILDSKADIGNRHPHTKELLLVLRAFDYIKQQRKVYDFVFKVRFDNGVNAPILPIYSIYNPNNLKTQRAETSQMSSKKNVFASFQGSLNDAYRLRLQRLPTLHERVYAWVITAGNPVFIESTLFDPNHRSTYTPIIHAVWNQPLRDFIDTKNSTLVTYRDVIPVIRQTMINFQPVYMIGSTWIHFGPYAIVEAASRRALEGFGQWQWKDLGNYTRPPYFINVTEAIVRLVHWKYNYHLIDLIYWPDYLKSFNYSDTSSVSETFAENSKHYYWLVRTCDKQPMRKDCLSKPQ